MTRERLTVSRRERDTALTLRPPGRLGARVNKTALGANSAQFGSSYDNITVSILYASLAPSGSAVARCVWYV